MSETPQAQTSNASNGRRELLRTLAVRAVTVSAVFSGAVLGAQTVATSTSALAASMPPKGPGFRCYKLYTGPDNASHVLKGTIDQKDHTDVVSMYFKETPAHASLDWHDDPEPQFVITLSGTLEFTLRNGETFILRPGDVLLAEDDVGSGHKWRLIDDQPWRRAYVVLKPGAKDSFVPDAAGE